MVYKLHIHCLNNTTFRDFIWCFSTFSSWACAPSALSGGNKPVTEWNITEVPPPHHVYIIFHITPHPPPSHPCISVCTIKTGESESAGTSSSETYTSVCVFTPPTLKAASSPSLWWTPRWSLSSRLHPSPPLAGTLWCVCRHLSITHRTVQAFHSQQNA